MSSPREHLFVRALRLLADAVFKHPGWFLWPQLLLAAICVWYTVVKLEFDMDRNNLVGSEQTYNRNFLALKKEFPGEDDLVAVIESEDHEKNRQFVERLGKRIDAESTAVSPTNLFTDVIYKGDLTMMGRKALLFVPEDSLKEMRKALQDYRPFIDQFSVATNLESLVHLINIQVRTAKREDNTTNAALAQSLPALERIFRRATESLHHSGLPVSPGVDALFGAGEEAEREKYITFSAGRIYLATAKPRAPLESELAPPPLSRLEKLLGRVPEAATAKSRELRMTDVQGDLTDRAVLRFGELVKETQKEIQGVNVGLTGEPVLDRDEMNQSQHDSIVATIISLVLSALIFIIGYNQTGRPLKAVACLIVGLAYTMGFTTLVVGHLNILTITFVPMLIGLAIDFGVHFITRFEEELRQGSSDLVSLNRAMVNTGQGICTGAFTTAGAFLAMSLTDFKGIQEMGIITGGGMLVCLVPMMTMLPVLLLRKGKQLSLDHASGRRRLLSFKRHKPAHKKHAAHPTPAKEHNRHRVRLQRLWLDRPWTVVGVTLGICILAALKMRVPFDYNLLNMQSPGLASVIYERKLIDSAEKSVLYAAVMTDTAEDAVKLLERIQKLPSVATNDSMAGYLTQDPKVKLGLISEIRRETGQIHFSEPDRSPVALSALDQRLWGLEGYMGLAADDVEKHPPVDRQILDSLRGLRSAVRDLRVSMFQGDTNANAVKLGLFQYALLDDVRDTFSTLQTQDDTSGLRAEDLPPALRHRFIGATGKHLIQVYPKDDVWEHDVQERFVRDLQSVAPTATGTPVQLYYYTESLKQAYVHAAGWALLAILILVWLHFRSIESVALAMLPVAIGALWMVGFMGWAHIPFNPANIMTLPLVIGIGVTNGIHILNRYAEERDPGILAKSTGKAVLVSGLTAISGFGSLIVADHQGIRSLGWVMSVGVATCMIAGLTCLPAALILLGRRHLLPPKH